MDLIGGLICIFLGFGLIWQAFTKKDFYAAVLGGRVSDENRFRYPTWFGRIFCLLLGSGALLIGIGLIRQSLK